MGNVYIVQKGDSLWSISKKYGVTVEELKQINNLSSNLLKVGQVLKIPEEETIVDYDIYTVEKGDSLYKISQKFGVSVNDLKKYNNLTSDILNIGQQLLIPIAENEDEYINYTVQKGDSLYSIAQKFNTTVNEIKEYNNLSSNILQINQNIKVPIKVVEEKPNLDYSNYIVGAGDTLYSIASQNNTTVNVLKEINNLSSNILSIGQVLKIPKSITYTVKSGDSLYSIAQKYNTTVENLKSKNNLSSNLLSIGQTLII